MMSKAQQSIPNHRSISILKVANSLTTTVSCRGAEVYFPMQKVEKIRFKMSSEVVCPVRESSDHSPR
jgi:hypothetical protein